MTTALRIGTRGSLLALVQARLVAAALADRGAASTPVVVETAGDRRAPDTAWGEGAFVAAIERALLERRVDLAVHSAKDVPTREDAGLRIVAYLPRADARDALVVRDDLRASLGERLASEGLAALPPGSRIGTDSPRRTGFLRAIGPHLEVVPLHGNVDTRLRRLDEGEVEALILAVAGLERLGHGDRVDLRFDPSALPPAPGQGAIAVQARADDELDAAVAAIDHRPTRLAVELERAFLRAMGGGCRSPIGALATLDAMGMTIDATGGIASADGAIRRIDHVSGGIGAGARLAALLAGRVREGDRPTGRPRVLVTRAAEAADDLVAALALRGIDASVVAAIAIEPIAAGGELDRAIADRRGWDRIVVTSPTGARTTLAAMARAGLAPATVRWASVGDVTASVLRSSGVDDIWLPTEALADALAEQLPVGPGDRILVPRGDLAGDALIERLRDRGGVVRGVVAYRTVEAPPDSADQLARALADGPPEAVLYASGSAIRGLLRLAEAVGADVRHVPAVCLGPRTASVANEQGLHVIGIAPGRSIGELAALTASLLDPAGEARA